MTRKRLSNNSIILPHHVRHNQIWWHFNINFSLSSSNFVFLSFFWFCFFSTLTQPNHFFPRYSTINWGLCLPSACTHQDADHILESFIGPYNSTGIKLHINVHEENCYVRQHFELIEIITNDWRVLVTMSVDFAISIIAV